MFVGDKNTRHQKLPVKKIPANMYVAMGAGAFLCTLYGVFPGLLYAKLPFPLAYEPYAALKVIVTVQLLTATAAGFWLYLAKLGGEPTISLDTDWFYRKPAAAVLGWTLAGLREVKGAVEARGGALFQAAAPYVHNPLLVAVGFLRNTSYRAARSLERQGWTAKVAYDEDRHRVSTGFSVLLSLAFVGVLLAIALYQTIV
jgi:multicomponent Na+:H+ antiporter subunit D